MNKTVGIIGVGHLARHLVAGFAHANATRAFATQRRCEPDAGGSLWRHGRSE